MPSISSENQASLEAASHILAQRRRSGVRGERLSITLRPTTIDDAMEIQRRLSHHMQCDIAGWKCAVPADDKIVLAPIFETTVFREKESIICSVSDDKSVKIEPELAFVLGHDLPPRELAYSDMEMRAAISHVHLALEIIGCRYADPTSASFPELLADGLFNQGLFLGAPLDLAIAETVQEIAITLQVKDQVTQTFAGKHPAGNPLAPLYWLVNYLRQEGIGLRAGQAIITGSYAGSPDVPLYTDIHVQFGQLGAINVLFKQTVRNASDETLIAP
ncbi:2-keto-4-pentenoate hydratase [Undibacterium sp. MH2W]|uniref:2-keto-4-pentenoate hydratase n=1 Tax=Undibacterium sp. MH2W TaxID=3413044 RepID=UPI003BF0BEEF